MHSHQESGKNTKLEILYSFKKLVLLFKITANRLHWILSDPAVLPGLAGATPSTHANAQKR